MRLNASNNKIAALTTDNKAIATVAQSTYTTISSVTTQLNGKQDTLTPGTNITSLTVQYQHKLEQQLIY